MTPKRLIGIIVLFGIVIMALWLFLRGDSSQNNTKTGTITENGVSSLFPFSKSSTPTLEQKPATANGTPSFNEVANPEFAEQTDSVGNLIQVTNRLVAGLTALPIETASSSNTHAASNGKPSEPPSTTPRIRFVERGTGYIYDIDAIGKNEKKVSGTTIVRASDALFADGGATVIERYIKNDNVTAATFMGRINADTTSGVGSIVGSFLPDDISDITVSPDGKSILYLAPTSDGIAGISIKTTGENKKQLFTSPFTEWLVDWQKGGMYLTTKASGITDGFSYKISTTGGFERQLGNILGLTTKNSPDGKMVLYSIGGDTNLSLRYLSLKDHSDFDSGLKTLPEKCVWSKDSITLYCAAPEKLPDGIYPDMWYQGRIVTEDRIWKINTETGTIEKISPNTAIKLDVTKITLDQNEQYLYFVNKKDFTLWSLLLNH